MNLKLWILWLLALGSAPLLADDLSEQFTNPPATARPWVYWYFMDGNLTRDGMTADLEAMKKAGIGGAIFLEVDIGIPRGPVKFMSPQWQDLLVHAIHEADRLGIQIALGSGPGWCGTGGPWIKPELAMQHLVASETNVVGPMQFSAFLPRPQPREPYFGEDTLTPELKKEWQEFYRDEAVLAFPTPDGTNQIADVNEKALYYREPFSSKAGVKPFLPAPAVFPTLPTNACIRLGETIELTKHLSADGQLVWDVPPGKWTIMRLGRTLTGQTTRPAPQPGLGFETDKFDRQALDAHFADFIEKILSQTGSHTNANGGLTMLHFDSWEMGSQNWSPKFRTEFEKRRGYDPVKYLPTFTGHVVQSAEISERFLWDVRRTASELITENHVGYLAELAHKHNLTLSVEPYDLNPAGDLSMGRVADVPQGEFWYLGFNTTYSVIEAASLGHTGGRPIVAAEAFTSMPGEDWKAHPAALKSLGDWAFCAGINRFDFHRFEAQPWNDRWPGMTMGPYGVHWDRTQTWWDMVSAYHEYLARCQYLLQRGVTVADVCFLSAEGAPNVFRPPSSAVTGTPPDHSGYNFDGCAPETLLERATVKNGQLVFPGGTTYKILVLPEQPTMTPALLRKIKSLVRAGATVFGPPPVKSPSLSDYPQCDAEVAKLAAEIWGDCDGQNVFVHSFGKGRVLWQKTEVKPGEQYGDYAAITNRLAQMGVPPDFEATGSVRFTHRQVGDSQVYFVANKKPYAIEAQCDFRVKDLQPELWNPETGEISPLAVYRKTSSGISIPLHLEQSGSCFVVFRPQTKPFDSIVSFTRNGQLVTLPTKPAVIKIINATYGVPGDAVRTRDVRDKVQAIVNGGHLILPVGELAEGDDPAYGTVKTLVLKYTADGVPFNVSGQDPETLSFPSSEINRAAEICCDTKGRLEIIASQPGHYELTRASGKTNYIDISSVPEPQEITGAWDVHFPPKWGAPGQITLDQLISLSDSTNVGVKYFSGTVTYTKTFDWNPATESGKQKAEYWLDLGDVEVMARVKLNGHDLGILWKPPFRVDVTSVLKPSENILEVQVANLWPNRMIGDAALPEAQRFTWSSYEPFTKDSPLLNSGLLGPVKLRTTEIIPVK